MLNSPPTIPRVGEQSWVLKFWSRLWKRSEGSRANPAESNCNANDTAGVFLPSGPADPDSLWSGFGEAEDYISFVCLLEAENAMFGDLVLREVLTRASSWNFCQTDRKTDADLSIAYGYFITCPLRCIHPQAMHFITVYIPDSLILIHRAAYLFCLCCRANTCQ